MTPEQQLGTAIRFLQKLAAMPNQPGRMKRIKDTIRLLNDLWTEYENGELESIDD